MSHDPTRLGHRLRSLERQDPELLRRCGWALEQHGELSCGAALRVISALLRRRGLHESDRSTELDAQACLMALLQRQLASGRGAPPKRSRWPARVVVRSGAPATPGAPDSAREAEQHTPRSYLVHEAREQLMRKAPLPRDPEALEAMVRSRLAAWGVDAWDVSGTAASLRRAHPELFGDPGGAGAS